ncbi:MAG: MmgE/PrpD family protein [Chloroflexota bacterium]
MAGAPASDPLLAHLAGYAAGLRWEHLTPDALDGLKTRLVDTLGCAAGGLAGEPAAIARSLAPLPSGGPTATVWGTGAPSTSEWAAFANTLAVRYLDFNDTYFAREGGHPSDALAGVLAAAEAAGCSGREALVAMSAAYEVFCGLGEAERLASAGIDHSLHVAIAVAAGASRALGLDAGRTAHAIAMAAVANPSLRVARAGRLSMWKAGAPAQAAQAGVQAAHLAAAGMTGPEAPFSGEGGLAALLGEEPALPALGGQPLSEGGTAPFHAALTSIKRFPAQYNAQAAIQAALTARERMRGAEPVVIIVATYAHAVRSCATGAEKWDVRERETADHSIPYLVAVALADGEVTERQFTPQRMGSRDVRTLLQRIRVVEEKAMTARFPQALPARLEVVLADGRTLMVDVTSARGGPGLPPTRDEVEAKFHALADGPLGAGAAAALLARAWTLEAEPTLVGLAGALTQD